MAKRKKKMQLLPWAPAVRTASLIMTFGDHKGEAMGTIPSQYLCWLICNNVRNGIKIPNENPVCAFYCAQIELDRRAPLVPLLRVLPKVLDKLSMRCIEVWKQSRGPNEGLYSWAERLCLEAEQHVLKEYDNVTRLDSNGLHEIELGGIRWILQVDEVFSTLVDVNLPQ